MRPHVHRWSEWEVWEHIVTYAYGCETFLTLRRTCICGQGQDKRIKP